MTLASPAQCCAGQPGTRICSTGLDPWKPHGDLVGRASSELAGMDLTPVCLLYERACDLVIDRLYSSPLLGPFDRPVPPLFDAANVTATNGDDRRFLGGCGRFAR